MSLASTLNGVGRVVERDVRIGAEGEKRAKASELGSHDCFWRLGSEIPSLRFEEMR